MISSISFVQIFSAWMARAGDTEISSIINTVLYAAAVWTAAYRWRLLRRLNVSRAEQRFWMILFFVMLALGINKQLDFQVLLVEIGRPIALLGGWYESRRLVLAIFALIASGIAGLLTITMVFFVRKHWKNHRPALAGLLILCVYFIIEATSIGHLEEGLDAYKQWNIRLSDLIEMAGIILIMVNALSSRLIE